MDRIMESESESESDIFKGGEGGGYSRILNFRRLWT